MMEYLVVGGGIGLSLYLSIEYINLVRVDINYSGKDKSVRKIKYLTPGSKLYRKYKLWRLSE